MNIFHIPSGFPTRHNLVAGISAKDFIWAFSEQYPDINHVVSIFYETAFEFLFKGKTLMQELGMYARYQRGVRIEEKRSNLLYCYAPKSIIYSNRLGFRVNESWLKRHRQNLEYIIAKQGKPDIIHAQFTRYGGLTAWHLAKEFSIPYIITERLGPFPFPDMLKNGELIPDMYNPLKEANALVSVSDSHASDIRQYVDRDVITIPNLIDEEIFRIKPVTRVEPVFTFVTISSSFQPNKGIDTLLKAISIFKRNGGKAVFHIGGGGYDPYFPALNKLAADLEIQDIIIWLEKLKREEVAVKMQQSDCFISTSIYESFGLVCAEAIACGKPVIATRSGGAQSIVNDCNGILVNTNDPEMLAGAMEKMVLTRAEYDAEKISRDFKNRFSKEIITDQYHQLYQTILNKQ